MNNLHYQFISPKYPSYYNQTVKIRYKVFYESSNLPLSSVLDDKENNSRHLAAIIDDSVVGYIRITLIDNCAQLSQFFVVKEMRGRLAIARTLFKMAEQKAKELGAKKLYGEIRLPVTETATRYGFTVSKEVFPSSKTGILHRRIEKLL